MRAIVRSLVLIGAFTLRGMTTGAQSAVGEAAIRPPKKQASVPQAELWARRAADFVADARWRGKFRHSEFERRLKLLMPDGSLKIDKSWGTGVGSDMTNGVAQLEFAFPWSDTEPSQLGWVTIALVPKDSAGVPVFDYLQAELKKRIPRSFSFSYAQIPKGVKATGTHRDASWVNEKAHLVVSLALVQAHPDEKSPGGLRSWISLSIASYPENQE